MFRGNVTKMQCKIKENELDGKLLYKLDKLEKQFRNLYDDLEVGALYNHLNRNCQNLNVYFDLGEGFIKENSIAYSLEEQYRVIRTIDCSAFEHISRIRIDLIDTAGIIKINNLQFLGENDKKRVDSKRIYENLVFETNNIYGFCDNAQIIFDVENVKKIVIDYEYVNIPVGRISFLGDLLVQGNRSHEELKRVVGEKEKQRERLSKELAHYKEHYFAAINQREELKRNLADVTYSYNVIQNSQCWKLTKPLRVVLGAVENFMKSHRVTYLLGKGVKSVYTQGFRATLVKVKQYRRRSVAFGTYEEELLSARKANKNEICGDKRITFSIVVPLYNTPREFLKEMIQSVQNQTYPYWELCMADGSDATHYYVEQICQKYAASDKRIKYKKLESNGGISVNTNEALSMATGEYIGLFDHDDLLHPSALYEYRKAIDEKAADFIYCDENKFEKINGSFFEPNYKPDFDLDYLRTNNYICHFTVFSKDLLKIVGGFRKECDGSQDHDMILRLIEHANNIVHIPQILYHWRCSKNSVASDPNAKPYTAKSGILAVKEHLQRCGLNATVESSAVHPNVYRIKYELVEKPLISILIPNKDHIEELSRCIESIRNKSTYSNYEIIVIENNSTERKTFEYYEKIGEISNIQVITCETNGEFNYSKVNNYAVEFANGEHIILLNNDIEIITNNWIEEMLMYSQREDVGAVGAKLYYPNNTIQHAGVIVGIKGIAAHSHQFMPRSTVGYMFRCYVPQDLSAVTAACLMMKKSVFREVGGLDENNFKVAFNDIDLCMRIRKAGYLIVWTPYAEAYHYESISRGAEDTPEKRERFCGEIERFKRRWGKELEAGDPYYNPNLTLDREDFSYR